MPLKSIKVDPHKKRIVLVVHGVQVGGDRYLKARAEPYTFPVTKSVTKDLLRDAPKRPGCKD